MISLYRPGPVAPPLAASCLEFGTERWTDGDPGSASACAVDQRRNLARVLRVTSLSVAQKPKKIIRFYITSNLSTYL